MPIYKIEKYCVKFLKGIKFAEFINKKHINSADNGDLDDLYEGGTIDPARLGIAYGFRNKNIETMVQIDRVCLINKLFGRPMFE